MHRLLLLLLANAPPCCCSPPTAAAQAVRVWHQLHRTRIGVVGEPSPWLVASTPSKQAVTDSWGPTLVDVDMQELLDGLWGSGRFKRKEVAAAVADLLQGHAHAGGEGAEGCAAGGAPTVDAVDAEPAAKVYLSLRRLVDAHQASEGWLVCCVASPAPLQPCFAANLHTTCPSRTLPRLHSFRASPCAALTWSLPRRRPVG